MTTPISPTKYPYSNIQDGYTASTVGMGGGRPSVPLSFQQWTEMKRYTTIIYEFASEASQYSSGKDLYIDDLCNMTRILLNIVDSIYPLEYQRSNSMEKYKNQNYNGSVGAGQIGNGYGPPEMMDKQQQQQPIPQQHQPPQHHPQQQKLTPPSGGPYGYYDYYPGYYSQSHVPSPQILPNQHQPQNMIQIPTTSLSNNNNNSLIQIPNTAPSHQQPPMKVEYTITPSSTNSTPSLTSATNNNNNLIPTNSNNNNSQTINSITNSSPTSSTSSSSSMSTPMSTTVKQKSSQSSTTANNTDPNGKNFTGEVFFDDLSQEKPRRRRRTVYAAKRNLQCQHCNVTETPEWRRGPNGDHTLCNACGLHYAKSLKKKNKELQEREKEREQEERERNEREREKEKDTRKHSIDFVMGND